MPAVPLLRAGVVARRVDGIAAVADTPGSGGHPARIVLFDVATHRFDFLTEPTAGMQHGPVPGRPTAGASPSAATPPAASTCGWPTSRRGLAERLTDQPDRELTPAWSTDGRALVYGARDAVEAVAELGTTVARIRPVGPIRRLVRGAGGGGARPTSAAAGVRLSASTSLPRIELARQTIRRGLLWRRHGLAASRGRDRLILTGRTGRWPSRSWPMSDVLQARRSRCSGDREMIVTAEDFLRRRTKLALIHRPETLADLHRALVRRTWPSSGDDV